MPLSTILGRSLKDAAEGDELAAKAARASKVKQMWRCAIEVCCGESARAFLDHTNSVYIVREGDGDDERKVLIAYVDDSIFAAELSARSEMIRLKFLERFGEQISEFKVFISRGKYKENHPFRSSPASDEPATTPRRPLSEEKLKSIVEKASGISDDKMRDSLLKAMISSLERKYGEDD